MHIETSLINNFYVLAACRAGFVHSSRIACVSLLELNTAPQDQFARLASAYGCFCQGTYIGFHGSLACYKLYELDLDEKLVGEGGGLYEYGCGHRDNC